jgi:hypothetical protein
MQKYRISWVLNCTFALNPKKSLLMKVIDHINQAKETLVSFEVLPPLKGKNISSLYNHLDPLMEFKPSFINFLKILYLL